MFTKSKCREACLRFFYLCPGLDFTKCRKSFMKKIANFSRFCHKIRTETRFPASISSVHVLKVSLIFIEYQARCASKKNKVEKSPLNLQFD